MQTDFDINNFIIKVIEANQLIYKEFQRLGNFTLSSLVSKGFGGDISIKADLLAEEIFLNHLEPFGKIFSEEGGYVGSGEYEIVIDPLDGSDNFKSSIPYYGTSVSVKKDSKVFAGIITNLATQDVFIKTDNFFKRGKLFSSNYHDVISSTSLGVGIFERGYKNKKLAKLLRKNSIKYRVLGAYALSLALAHDVSFVLFDGELREFDISAGFFMCEKLYSYHNKSIYLISKEKETFDKIKSLIMIL